MFSDKGSQLNQTDEKFSGSAIGIAEQTQMPGMGKDNILIPSKYFVPLRMIPSGLEQDGSWAAAGQQAHFGVRAVLRELPLLPRG